jgi:type IV pilus assembly protein PilQ
VTVVAASAFVSASAPAGPSAAPTVRLKAISSHMSARGASLVIEATEPVAYLTSRPDPLTVLLDFRNVGIDGISNTVGSNGASPIAGVSIEPSESLGAPAARVRIALAQAVGHRVHSDRNTVVVEFEKPSSKGVPYVLPPVARATAGVAAPDAMMALGGTDRSAVDPIATLGLGAAPPATPAVAPVLVAADPLAAYPLAVYPLSAYRPVPTPPATAPVTIIPLGAAPVAARPSVAELVVPAPVPPYAVTASTAAAAMMRLTQAPAAQPPPTPPAPPAPERFATGRVERKFSGHPVSLDFQGADLRAVLRTFAEISGLNIVIEPAVQGTVDVALRDVPWDQALDIILRANKLGFLIDGTIVRIAPLTVLAEEESQRRKLAEEQALSGQVSVMTKTLSYAEAKKLVELLTKSVLSQRGTVQVDERTNTLIVTDLPDRLTSVNELIATLDRPQPQVEIEARIINTNKDYARALGVQWGFGGRVDPALGNTTNLAFPNRGSLSGRTGLGTGTQAPASAAPNSVNLPAGAASSAVGLALGSVNGAFNLDVALSALETSGNGRILSTPRVTTQNNIEAEIAQGVKLPVTVAPTVGSPATTTYVDAALILRVTPQITAAGTVIMKISVDNGSPGSVTPSGISINTQRASTTLLVGDGQTTVIGGIYSSTNTTNTDRTPGLGSVPLLKWLFKRDSVSDRNTELLIFITPRIVKS